MLSKFTIRDIVLLLLFVVLAGGWYFDHNKLATLTQRLEAAEIKTRQQELLLSERGKPVPQYALPAEPTTPAPIDNMPIFHPPEKALSDSKPVIVPFNVRPDP